MIGGDGINDESNKTAPAPKQRGKMCTLVVDCMVLRRMLRLWPYMFERTFSMSMG